MKGIEQCIVGYCGGKKLNPTYRNILDSTESVLVEYDPDQISFSDILAHWKKSAYGYPGIKRQYRAAVFYTDPKQERFTNDVVEKMKQSNGGKEVYIDVEPVNPFYKAEEYHQDYLAKKQGNGASGGMCAI